QRRDLDLAAQCRGGEADRHLAVQVVAFALEHGVRADVDFHVQIPRPAAIDARFAVAAVTQAQALVDTGRNLQFQCLVALDAPRATAAAAGIGDHADGTVALGAGLLDREEALLHAYLTGAAAGRAGLWLGARFGATAVAGAAGFRRGNADGLVGAARGFLK